MRKWYPIKPSMEFRGYFANGNLNALSQYNYVCLYPEVTNYKAQIVAEILKFFEEKMKPILAKKFTEYIIDFAVVGDRVLNGKFSFDRLMIIELNPFLTSTDSLLFSWKEERGLLEHGPFEFRVREKEVPNVATKVSPEWRAILEEELKRTLKK